MLRVFEVTVINMYNELPSVIIESEEFRGLEEEQRLSFLHRLRRIRTLGEELSSGSRLLAAPDFCDFAEDLELDLTIAQEFDDAHRGGLSRWIIHYSWSFETAPFDLVQALSPRLTSFLDQYEPPLLTPPEGYSVWFKELGEQLFLAVSEFSASKTFTEALAACIVLDLLLSRLLTACFKLRLNKDMPR